MNIGLRLDVLGAGLVFLLIGIGGVTGLIPLAYLGINTITVSNVQVTVSDSNEVIYSADLLNNWNETLSVDGWAQVKSSSNVVVAGPFRAGVTLSAYGTGQLSQSMGILSSSTQQYTFELYVWSGTLALAPPTYVSFSIMPDITIDLGVLYPATPGGSTSPPPGSYDIVANSPFTVTAIPNPGYTFNLWAVDVEGSITRYETQNPLTVTVDRDTSITASFEKPAEVTLTVDISPEFYTGETPGTTAPMPGVYTYNLGDSVTLTAFPGEGWNFNFWGISGTNLHGTRPTTETITVTIDRDSHITAYFIETPLSSYVVKMSVFPAGAGTTAPPPGEHHFIQDTDLTIAAFDFMDYDFAYWEVNGETVSTSKEAIVKVTTGLDIVAHFKEAPDDQPPDEPPKTEAPSSALAPVLTGIGSVVCVASAFVPGGKYRLGGRF